MKRTNKLGFAIFTILSIAVFTGSMVFAKPTIPQNKGTDNAKTVSPVFDDDGQFQAPPQAVHELPENQLNKIIFIRYDPHFAKNKPCNYDGTCDVDEGGWCRDCKGAADEEVASDPCYDFLAGSKPRWNWVEDYYVSDSALAAAAIDAVDTWEAATIGDIFGVALDGSSPWGVYDYENSLSFGDYPEEGVIGVTAVWYKGKNIYEYDIMFDTDYFSDSPDIDLATVVLHEYGHAAGLGDLYDVNCINEVMYGIYEGIKLNLWNGDLIGIQELYGY